MPLLQHLQFKEKAKETDDVSEDAAAAAAVEETIEAIDDAQSSTLTKGQHARYLQLQSGDSWNEGKRKEFRQLHHRVKEERDLYHKALETFWDKHRERYRVGLESPFSRYCFAYVSMYEQQWHGPKYYGKCRQVVSLQHVSLDAFSQKMRKSSSHSFTIDSISHQVVHVRGEEPPTVVDWENCSPVFEASNMPASKLLYDDPLALDLAKEHDAAIVTTRETLQTLLQLSAFAKVPMSRRDGVVILDMPLPQPTTPRDCVSRGVTEGFYQALSNNTSPSLVYTLLTLPSKTEATRSRRVLVRSNRRLQDDKKQTISVHAQLEYFPNRGWEEIPSYERTLWILDKLLFDARVLVARVCPSTMRPLTWEETGVAHALASGTTVFSSIDPMNHWHALREVLYAMETMLEGNHLLCFENSFISVHTASEDDRVIDIYDELNKAEAVYTGAVALRTCARVWRWNQDRIPYTFPIKDGKAKNKKR
jgi:hypothetical protein